MFSHILSVLFFPLNIYFIYLFGCTRSELWHLVPWPGTEPALGAHRVLATGPPGKSLKYSLFFKNIILFISFFLAVLGFLQLQRTGFSPWWSLWSQSTGSRVLKLQQLQHAGSVVEAPRFESTWTQLLPSMWGLPRSGIKAMSPALAGGFFTLSPQGSPRVFFILWDQHGSLAEWPFLGNCFKLLGIWLNCINQQYICVTLENFTLALVLKKKISIRFCLIEFLPVDVQGGICACWYT